MQWFPFFSKSKPQVQKYVGHGTPVVSERSDPRSSGNVTTHELVWMRTHPGLCPDCGCKLIAGPEGGASQNAPCSNPECRSEFNIMGGFIWVERSGKMDVIRRDWFCIPRVNVGMSDFAKGRHRQGLGYSYFRGTDEELLALVDKHWIDRLPGAGRKDLSKVIIIPLPTDGFVGTTVVLEDFIPLKAEVKRRQEHEDPYVKVSAVNADPPPPNFVKIVCYNKDALLENDGKRSGEFDWEVVAIIASDVDNEPMHPLAMARNFLVKPGGTYAPYTAEQFAEAIYYWSMRVGMD